MGKDDFVQEDGSAYVHQFSRARTYEIGSPVKDPPSSNENAVGLPFVGLMLNRARAKAQDSQVVESAMC